MFATESRTDGVASHPPGSVLTPMTDDTPEFRTRSRALCPVCGGRRHRHEAKVLADFDCYWRQFSRVKLPTGDPLPIVPSQLREFAGWLEGGNARPRPKRNHEDAPQDPRARVYF